MSSETENRAGGIYYRNIDSYVRSRAKSHRRRMGYKSRSRSRSKPAFFRSSRKGRVFSSGKSSGIQKMLTVASYLHKKTGRSWFVGPNGLYLSVPAGVNAGPAAMELLSDIPEVRNAVTYAPGQNQLFIPAAKAKALAQRLTMRDESIRQYCQKVGARHEQRFFGHPYACDPWLASHFRFGGAMSGWMVPPTSVPPQPLPASGGMCSGSSSYGRLQRVAFPLMRKKRKGMAPLESATDFKIGTVKVGQDGITLYRIVKSGKTRRWSRIASR